MSPTRALLPNLDFCFFWHGWVGNCHWGMEHMFSCSQNSKLAKWIKLKLLQSISQWPLESRGLLWTPGVGCFTQGHLPLCHSQLMTSESQWRRQSLTFLCHVPGGGSDRERALLLWVSSFLFCCLPFLLFSFLPLLSQLFYWSPYSCFVSDFKNYSKQTWDLHFTFHVAEIPPDVSWRLLPAVVIFSEQSLPAFILFSPPLTFLFLCKIDQIPWEHANVLGGVTTEIHSGLFRYECVKLRLCTVLSTPFMLWSDVVCFD